MLIIGLASLFYPGKASIFSQYTTALWDRWLHKGFFQMLGTFQIMGDKPKPKYRNVFIFGETTPHAERYIQAVK